MDHCVVPILRRQVKRAGARRGEAGVSHQALDHSRMTLLTREEQQVRIRRVRASWLLGEERSDRSDRPRGDGGLELRGPDVVLRARRGVQLPRRHRGRDRIWVFHEGRPPPTGRAYLWDDATRLHTYLRLSAMSTGLGIGLGLRVASHRRLSAGLLWTRRSETDGCHQVPSPCRPWLSRRLVRVSSRC